MKIISDLLWDTIKEIIPAKTSKRGRPEMCPRQVLNAIYFVLRTGCQWKALKIASMGAPSTIHGKFMKWIKNGVFEKLYELARTIYHGKRGVFGIWYATDTISVKAPHGGEKTGKNPTDRRKLGSKRSVIIDQRGAPLATTVGAANSHDSQLIAQTICRLNYEVGRIKILAADAAYDSQEIKQLCKNNNFILLAATNKRRSTNRDPYSPRHRWIVERTQAWLNLNRGLKIRWARTEISFQAFSLYASANQLFKMAGIFG